MIPYGRQSISAADVAAVVEVLRSDFLTQGPCVSKFEASVARVCGTANAVAVNSATSALHIACLALGVGPGDRVWTVPNTFVASSNCALYCGATVDFVDIDSRTYNMSVPALESKLQLAERSGTLPKVVIPVHFSGQSCEMREIQTLAKRYGFRLIEDASHAIGGSYLGRPIGSCAFSDITVFSFHPVKIITTAEGGMALTNDAELAARMQLLRAHGVTRERQRMELDEGPWYYEQVELGFNYRMTDLQAALGSSQLQRLSEFVARRHAIATYYASALAKLPLILPWQADHGESAFHLYVVQVDTQRTKASRREVFERLRGAGIGVNVHYIPVHTQPYYRKLGFRRGQFPESERYYARAISLPMYADLSERDLSIVVAALEAALSA